MDEGHRVRSQLNFNKNFTFFFITFNKKKIIIIKKLFKDIYIMYNYNMDISYNFCYMYRVDAKITPEFEKYIENKCKYYVGTHEISEDGKHHYQMCLMMDDKKSLVSLRNIKTKKWVSSTYQPVALKIARNDEVLMSYSTKIGITTCTLVTNLTVTQIAAIKPWKKQHHCKGCNCKNYKKIEYIIIYIKKLLKDKQTEYIKKCKDYEKSLYVGTSQNHQLEDYYENNVKYDSVCYDTEENYIPSKYECIEIISQAHAHFFEKYDKHICRSSLIKIMLKTGLITHQDYIKKTLGNLLSEDII
jgi:hypothetical protein